MLLACTAAQAQRTWQVGPDGSPLSLQQALKQAADGDSIELASGDYLAPVAVITQRRLTLRGASPRPRLIAAGQNAEGKAIWVIRGGEIRIENLEFRDARVADRNGAGIRLERGKLWLRGCAFIGNETGLMTANDPAIELHIEDSHFEHAVRTGPGLAHLLYVGSIGELRIRGSRFHHSEAGHLIKSRARQSWIAYNLIADGPRGQASYELEFPNGGDVTLIGNLVVQGERTQNNAVIAYGAEGPRWPLNRLRLVHNSLLNDRLRPAEFLKLWPERLRPAELLLLNNLTVGPGSLEAEGPAQSAGNLGSWRQLLREPARHDYALRDKSAARGKAVAVTDYGAGLQPEAEFQFPIGTRPLRPLPKDWLPGAIQR